MRSCRLGHRFGTCRSGFVQTPRFALDAARRVVGQGQGLFGRCEKHVELTPPLLSKHACRAQPCTTRALTDRSSKRRLTSGWLKASDGCLRSRGGEGVGAVLSLRDRRTARLIHSNFLSIGRRDSSIRIFSRSLIQPFCWRRLCGGDAESARHRPERRRLFLLAQQLI